MSLQEKESRLSAAQEILSMDKENCVAVVSNTLEDNITSNLETNLVISYTKRKSQGDSAVDSSSHDQPKPEILVTPSQESSMSMSQESCANSEMSFGDNSSKNGEISSKDTGKECGKSSDVEPSGEKRSDTSSMSSSTTGKKKKKGSWYNVLAPNYKSRSEDFKKIFKNIPGDERLLVDYSCALQKDILVHGRLYITQNWICFYANIFRWETMLTIRCDNIKAITKEKTARVIPNAVQILTENEKYFFTSFASRDKAFLMLFRVWQNALMDQPMDSQELWQMVHHSYGEELGLTSSDDDYVAPPVDEDEQSSSLTVHYKSKDDDGSDNIKILKESTSALITPNSSYSQLETDGSPTIDQTMTVPNDDPSDFEMFTENLCENHEHPGKLFLDEVFSIDVDQMFQLLFTDSEFYLEFIRARKTSDLKLAPWPDESDENGGKCRTITYTLSLNYHIGPKSTLSIEKQSMQSDTRPGNCYIIDTEVTNPSVPHGDSFYVFSRYCILKVSEKRSRLKVHSEVRYLKNAWGLVKNMIEKGASVGISENFELLAVHLRKEADKIQEFHNPSVTTIANSKKRQNRRRRKNSIDRIVKVLPETNMQNERTFVEFTSFIRMDTYTLIRLLYILLGVLIFMNFYLYMKVSQLESKANPAFSARRYQDFRPDQNVPEKWSNVINEQQSLHKNEMEYWKEILGSSILVIDQIKKTLEGLQATVDHKLQESTANN